jgi:hypothetical protein
MSDQTKTVEVSPCFVGSSHKMGHLVGLTKNEIVEKLGEPNMQDDPDKVRFSWGFTVNGEKCAVWDWNGSSDAGEWSFFGDFSALELVFGPHVTS